MKKMYYVYMLRCQDDTIYTGITVDLDRRMKEHFEKDKKCAKYTFVHIAKKLECAWETENKSLASKLEFNIKRLKKSQKEDIIKNQSLERYLKDKVEIEKYKIKDIKTI